uniref:Uncharacterized protein n=1 Tax=Rhizophora mucronata TaxID=61149 RepID=A0A2P2PL95_RHIMU
MHKYSGCYKMLHTQKYDTQGRTPIKSYVSAATLTFLHMCYMLWADWENNISMCVILSSGLLFSCVL